MPGVTLADVDGDAIASRTVDSPLITGPIHRLASGWVTVTPEDLLFHDEFESGGTSARSAVFGGG